MVERRSSLPFALESSQGLSVVGESSGRSKAMLLMRVMVADTRFS